MITLLLTQRAGKRFGKRGKFRKKKGQNDSTPVFRIVSDGYFFGTSTVLPPMYG